jgi:leucyl/phenylalanyl-tRNA--protein transferase
VTRLDPALLLSAYAAGIFPMADSRDARDLFWVEPERRAILPLDGFVLSKSLRKTIRADRFRVTRDQAFVPVMQACADRAETWINPAIERGYTRLHEVGHAHSVECWAGDDLVGGLYGVRLGGAFFGESMFSRATDASKVALAWLVARLRVGRFRLLDCQFMTPHLASLGAVEIGKADYAAVLGAAVAAGDATTGGAAGGGTAGLGREGLGRAGARVDPALPDFSALDVMLSGATSVPSPAPGCVIAQLLGQTS